MGNPLACSVANASINLLLGTNWQARITEIEQQLKLGVAPAIDFDNVVDVRCLGAVGVIEMTTSVDLAKVQQQFVAEGLWVRPFGSRVYVMPPYIISKPDLDRLITGMLKVVKNYQ
jgi:adenosylmethionine-8-amino-7-oxononanoate aminotransferase